MDAEGARYHRELLLPTPTLEGVMAATVGRGLVGFSTRTDREDENKSSHS
jgi:hypothetical protein